MLHAVAQARNPSSLQQEDHTIEVSLGKLVRS